MSANIHLPSCSIPPFLGLSFISIRVAKIWIPITHPSPKTVVAGIVGWAKDFFYTTIRLVALDITIDLLTIYWSNTCVVRHHMKVRGRSQEEREISAEFCLHLVAMTTAKTRAKAEKWWRRNKRRNSYSSSFIPILEKLPLQPRGCM